jgi:DNA polymerase III epsilon subunit-like protein
MKMLIFDTETSGLPKNYKKQAVEEPNNWPHIVSISWVVLDIDTNKIECKKSYLIKPDNWIISSEVSKIHGITHDYAMSVGVPLIEAMGAFTSEKYDYLVAHNIDFDYNVLMNAYHWDLKNELTHRLMSCPRKCTMKLATDICKFPGNWGKFRWPKLSELYEFTFHRKPISTSLHSSLYDTLILAEVIQNCDELRHKMDLPVKSTFVSNGSRNKTFLL